jgi:hypothetical protein
MFVMEIECIQGWDPHLTLLQLRPLLLAWRRVQVVGCMVFQVRPALIGLRVQVEGVVLGLYVQSVRFHFCFETFHSLLWSHWAALFEIRQ